MTIKSLPCGFLCLYCLSCTTWLPLDLLQWNPPIRMLWLCGIYFLSGGVAPGITKAQHLRVFIHVYIVRSRLCVRSFITPFILTNILCVFYSTLKWSGLCKCSGVMQCHTYTYYMYIHVFQAVYQSLWGEFVDINMALLHSQLFQHQDCRCPLMLHTEPCNRHCLISTTCTSTCTYLYFVVQFRSVWSLKSLSLHLALH